MLKSRIRHNETGNLYKSCMQPSLLQASIHINFCMMSEESVIGDGLGNVQAEGVVQSECPCPLFYVCENWYTIFH